LLQVEQDRVATAETPKVCCRLETPATDRQLVGAEDDQLLETAPLEANTALAVNWVPERSPGQH